MIPEPAFQARSCALMVSEQRSHQELEPVGQEIRRIDNEVPGGPTARGRGPQKGNSTEAILARNLVRGQP